jgi:hypothetical protein
MNQSNVDNPNFAVMRVWVPNHAPHPPAIAELLDDFYSLQYQLERLCETRVGSGSLLLFWEMQPEIYRPWTRMWASNLTATPRRDDAVPVCPEEIEAMYHAYPQLMRNSGFEPVNPDDPNFGDEIPW